MHESAKRVTITLRPELVARIRRACGDVPVSRWFQRAAEEKLDRDEPPAKRRKRP